MLPSLEYEKENDPLYRILTYQIHRVQLLHPHFPFSPPTANMWRLSLAFSPLRPPWIPLRRWSLWFPANPLLLTCWPRIQARCPTSSSPTWTRFRTPPLCSSSAITAGLSATIWWMSMATPCSTSFRSVCQDPKFAMKTNDLLTLFLCHRFPTMRTYVYPRGQIISIYLSICLSIYRFIYLFNYLILGGEQEGGREEEILEEETASCLSLGGFP